MCKVFIRQKRGKEARGVHICIAVAFCILACLLLTGCVRVAKTIDGIFWGSGSGALIDPNTKVFYGTREIAPYLATEYAPLALLDLPFEILYDSVFLPFQGMNALDRMMREGNTIRRWRLVDYIYRRDFKRFKKRLSYGSYSEDALLYCWNEHLRRGDLMPYIDLMLKRDRRYMRDLMQSRHYMYPSNFGLVRHAFDRGMRVEDFPKECAVVNAVNNLFDPKITSADIEFFEKQVDLIQFLLEHKCNQNAVNENVHDTFLYDPNWSWDHPYPTALDQALIFSSSECREGVSEAEQYAISERLLALLRQYGAKSGRELKLWRNLPNLGIGSFFYLSDFDRFKERLPKAEQKDKQRLLEDIITKPEKYEGRAVSDVFQYFDLLLVSDVSIAKNMLFQDSMLFSKNIEFYRHAFASGLSPKDFPEEHAILSFCTNLTYYTVGYDKYATEFLRMLLDNGCNPNHVREKVCFHRGSGSYSESGPYRNTALDCIRNHWQSKRPVISPKEREKLLKEIEQILLEHGAKTGQEVGVLRNPMFGVQ